MDEAEAKLIKELEKIGSGSGAYTIISKPEDYQMVNSRIIKFLTENKNTFGIYITLSIPHKKISADLEKSGVDTKKLYFIDGSGNLPHEGEESEYCTYLHSRMSLTNLSLAISAAIKTEKFSFCFLDSISTLLVYNSIESTGRFIHFLINKMRNLDLMLILRSVIEKKSNELMPTLSQFCDKCIYT